MVRKIKQVGKKDSIALTRDAILDAADSKLIRVDVPEWDGHLFVKNMTGQERDKFEAGMVEQRGKSRKMNFANMRARLVTLVAVDKDGNRLFTDNDVAMLGEKSAKALDRVFTEAQKLNGLTESDIEELTQELEDSPFDDSVLD